MKTKLILFFAALCLTSLGQKQFTNNGNFKIHNGGSMSVYGDFINNGSFADDGLQLTLAGSSLQSIGGTTTTTFNNLVLANPVGSTLTANQKISGILTISQGTFATNGKTFTLLSDANNTARIAPITGDFSGNITMQRYLGTGPTDWRQLASPVSSVTINDWQDDFTTSGFSGSHYPSFGFVSVYTYDETIPGIMDYGYASPTNASNALNPGKGFFAYVGPTPITVDVTGPPAKFTQTFNVSYTPNAGVEHDGWMLLGNPYPCPIDWTSASWTKSNINDAIYIWNPQLQQYASYVSGVNTNGGSSIIASSQSFWVQSSGAGASLSCDENVKFTGNSYFVRPANNFPVNMKLSLTGNNYSDEMIIRFGSPATGKFDKELDARKMFTTSQGVPSISSYDSTSTDMSVNSMPVFNNEIKIPVKTLVASGYSGNYTIKFDSTTVLPEGYCVVLEDLVTGTKTNISNSSSYSFYISDTTKAPRFIIHARAAHQVNTFAAKCNSDSTGKIVAEAKGQAPWNYIWMDATNTVVKSSVSATGKDSLENRTAGNYFVYIISANNMCGSFVTTVTINQPEPVVAGFHAPTSTVHVSTESFTVQNTSYNAVNYQWNFGDGSVLTSAVNPPPHVYNSVGEHTIVLTATNNGCNSTFKKVIMVTDQFVQGIEEMKTETGISIYPNPGEGLFNFAIEGQIPQGSHIEVYDAAGKKIIRKQVSTERTELDLRNEAKGIYFYNIILGDKVSGGKLIVK